MILRQFPPMGVYETLFRFADATSKYMGEPGTHPWAQGYPITTPVPGGPSLPDSIAIDATDRMYPKADGEPPLRAAITPRLPQSLRATYLSMQSLVGRLAFAGTLLLLSTGTVQDAAPDWPALSSMSRTCALVGLAGFLMLAATARGCLLQSDES